MLDDEPPPRRGMALKVCGAGDRGQRMYAIQERDGLVRLLTGAAHIRAGAVHHCAGALWRQLRRKLWQSCVNCHKNQHSCVLTRRRGPALAAAHRLS